MKKLIRSTFAMSLILFASAVSADSVEDALKLQEEIGPELKGPQRFSPLDLHQQKDWQVTPRQVERDVTPFKGQQYSIIPWETLSPETWLDIDLWIAERDVKDQNPDWKLRLRDERRLELIGKILNCKGECEVFRGLNPASVQHLSRLREGDELRTGKDSVAWVYLMDGTLFRLAPESSLSLQEINWGKSEVFFLMRLNSGHIFWHPRSKESPSLELAPETDAVSLPLLVRNANQEFFERKAYQKQKALVNLSGYLDLEEEAMRSQINRLNELKAANGNLENISTKVMMVAPNATVLSSQASFDFVYVPGGQSFFKKRTVRSGEELSLHLRGYRETEVHPITNTEWNEVNTVGRSYGPMVYVPGHLQVLELLTRRIKTIELAREIWFSDFTLPILSALSDPKKLAVNHGYTLWGEESKRRQTFLVEYTRRIETANLRSLENLLEKLSSNGEKVRRKLSSVLYEDAINHYLLGLKTRYTDKKLQVREMNDLQYYAWILKNGKI